MPGMARVCEVNIYPVKSLRRNRVESRRATTRGFEGDRRWMVIRPDGSFVTQREDSVLATIDAHDQGGQLVLSAEGNGTVDVDVPNGQVRTATIWGTEVDCVDAGDNAACWLTGVAGFDVRLVHMPENSIRPTPPDFSEPGDCVSFADAFPYLLTNVASLDDLNERLATPVAMDRFRPNIVIEGLAPLEEDSWRRVRVGECEFRVVKDCGRCIVTTTDQLTGQRPGSEPLATLTNYRLKGKAAVFGVNLIPDVLGEVRLGDTFEVLETGRG